MLPSGRLFMPATAGRRARTIAGLTAAGLLLTVSACLTAPNVFGREWAEQLAASPPCTLDVLGVPDTVFDRFRYIESRGFSVCIPDDWRLRRQPPLTADPYSRGSWLSHAQDLSLSWRYAPGAAIRECGNEIPIGRQAQTFTERIGEENVCIYLSRGLIRAYWEDGFTMTGNARDVLEVDVLLTVIRTVRLVAVWKLDE